MKIGAHVSTAGGIDLAIKRIETIDGNCLQIFISSPQSWRSYPISVGQIKKFKQAAKKYHIAPIFIHALYLVNLATDNFELHQKTVQALINTLDIADQINAEGVIFHSGSAKIQDRQVAIGNIISTIKEILDSSDSESQLVIENSAGQGGTVGVTVDELAKIYQAVNSPKLKICFDTCHLFAAGYELRRMEKINQLVEEFNQKIGLENLVAIHANDSKYDLGAHRDRHDNIGAGYLGKEAFRLLVNHSKLKNLPWILEVPGFDNQGPDTENINILKSLIGKDN